MADKPDTQKGRLTRIKSGALSRGIALAKVSLGASARAAGHAMTTLMASPEERAEKFKELLFNQATSLAREFGQLKGTLMKAGQSLSMLGEYFLPPEINKVLKSLQSDSPPLAWPEIEKVIKRQLSVEVLAELDIDPEPHASASLGQVHRATVKTGPEAGTHLAIKVQYPGVDKAIDSDLRALKSILSVSKLLPVSSERMDALFAEVRQMMNQEVDYERELKATDEYREWLHAQGAESSRYVVPRTFHRYSSSRVLATSFELGVGVDSPEVKALSQERRNALAVSILDLYFREIFKYKRVQTDPHFGNYRIRIGNGSEPDRWVLLDFGAVRKFPETFLEPYEEMIAGTFHRDRPRTERACIELGFLKPEDPEDLKAKFYRFLILFLEPFAPEAGVYDYAASDLPKRVAQAAMEIVMLFKLRPPPREIIFLDRKIGGVYVIVAALGARLNARSLLEPYLRTRV